MVFARLHHSQVTRRRNLRLPSETIGRRRGPVIRNLVLAAAVALFAFASAAADAHAYVDSSLPVPGANLATAPRAVSVSFDEPISLAGDDALVVRDEAGRVTSCTPAAAIDPYDVTRAVCSLPRGLTRGRYVVSWRVVSADTHVVHGSFAFGVGIAASAAVPEAESMYDPSAAPAAVLRWLALYGTLVACGTLAFEAAVARGTVQTMRGVSARCRTLAKLGLVVALVVAAPALAVQTLAESGGRPGALASSMLSTGSATTWGHAWSLRVIALVALLATSLRKRDLPVPFTLVVSIVALVSFSLSSHAMGGASPRLETGNVIADLFHLAGAALWVGGLTSFVVTLPLVTLRSALAAFSPLAVAAVLAIVLSGTYASIVHVGTFQALFDSAYGRIVVAKIALLIPLLVLGARNLARGRDLASVGNAARDLRIEAALALAIVALSAVLTGLPPPRQGVQNLAVTHE